MIESLLKKIFGNKTDRERRRIGPKVEAINALETEWRKLSDEQLRGKTAEFRQKLDNGAKLDDLLVPAFATVREASRRVLEMRHYDVQMFGGVVLHEGRIAEMRTGEGKTLVATLPCYLNALEGKGVHVVTVNDYLARRDSEWMGKVYGFLGMSTGLVVPGQSNLVKKRMYQCDITYGQNNEFGFDYLRDNMKFSIHEYVQRELNFAIVDEVDSILIDEARTPLIISGPGEMASDKYQRITDIIPRFQRDEHYEVDEKGRSVTITDAGNDLAQKLLAERGLLEGGNLYDPLNLETLHILQQCLRGHVLYHRDQHYLVSPDQHIVIIDEFTGRTLKGRRWSDGLHQAVEAKERVPIQEENITLATISFQNLFRLYRKLGGMTGTAETEASEFHQIYKLDVIPIPTNKPILRKDFDDLVYKTDREKWNAVVSEVKDALERGQPVLVGTTSVEKSDHLSRLLEKAGVKHNVLNAKQHEREAYVVAQAGVPGSVTVATNMAGRGTDILLGGNPEMLARLEVMNTAPPEVLADPAAMAAAVDEAIPHYTERCKRDAQRVREAGGLRIIGTERHESRRIDNQLRGRAGRQGDPGESRFYLSLEDDLMRIFAGERVQLMMDRLGMEEDVPIEHPWVTKAVENAQKKVEERNFDVRKQLLEYDDVMNQQRKSIYALRRQVLTGQYRTVPTDDERKKGIEPKPRVAQADPELAKRVEPLIDQMIKIHGAPPASNIATQEELEAYVAKALSTPLELVESVRIQPLGEDLYKAFGCLPDLKKHAHEPRVLREKLIAEVALSLTEQRERMFDLIDEIVGTMVAHACPPGGNYERWDLPSLERAYREQFKIEPRSLVGVRDATEVAEKLYADAEAVLQRKLREFGPEQMLHFFRDFFLKEIDRLWIDHLQGMDGLRDGIGLVAYGQRDPKKEYKRVGFTMFQGMLQNIKSGVATDLFTIERARPEDIERYEAQQRRLVEEREARLRLSGQPDKSDAPAGRASAVPQPTGRASAAPAAQRGPASPAAQQRASVPQPFAPTDVAPPRGALPGAQAKPQTVKREQPKVGRNDPCWCGSGKKYKNCHLKADAGATGGEP